MPDRTLWADLLTEIEAAIQAADIGGLGSTVDHGAAANNVLDVLEREGLIR